MGALPRSRTSDERRRERLSPPRNVSDAGGTWVRRRRGGKRVDTRRADEEWRILIRQSGVSKNTIHFERPSVRVRVCVRFIGKM